MKRYLNLTGLVLAAAVIVGVSSGRVFARLTGTDPGTDIWCMGPSGAEGCFDASGNLIPTTTNDAALGSTSLRWSKVWTTDLDASGTLTFAAGAIDTAKLATDAVTTVKILNGAVDTAKLGSASVTTIKIALLAVDTGRLASDSVTNAKVLKGSIDTSKLIAGTTMDTGKLLCHKANGVIGSCSGFTQTPDNGFQCDCN